MGENTRKQCLEKKGGIYNCSNQHNDGQIILINRPWKYVRNDGSGKRVSYKKYVRLEKTEGFKKDDYIERAGERIIPAECVPFSSTDKYASMLNTPRFKTKYQYKRGKKYAKTLVGNAAMSGTLASFDNRDSKGNVIKSPLEYYTADKNVAGIRRMEIYKRWLAGYVTMKDLVAIYSAWRDYKQYLFLASNKGNMKALLCSKRGNSKYVARIRERFSVLDGMFDNNHVFFKKADADAGKRVYTPALLVTLTTDTKLMSNVESWETVGNEFNRFVSGIKRSISPNFDIIRTFEATCNGYSHIHAILWFRDYSFDVKAMPDSRNVGDFEGFGSKKYQYRVDDNINQILHNHWHSDIVDVRAIDNLCGAMQYITKYIRKSFHTNDELSVLNQALQWVHGKRSFSISGECGKRLDAYTHNSNVKKAKELDKNNLYGKKWYVFSEKWYVFGYGGFKSLATCTMINNEELWVYELTRLPEKVARYAALFCEKSNNPEKIRIGNEITDSFLRLQSHRQSAKKTVAGSVSMNLKPISQSRTSSGMLVNNF